jgi:multiple antibiotic resistance protein
MKFSLVLKYFISLFMICSPLTAIPVFLNLTPERSKRDRAKVGIWAGVAVSIILGLTVWIGAPLLRLLGIQIGAFQFAGGIVVFLLALSMLNAQTSPIRQTKEEVSVVKPSVAVVPLAIPLMAGPGAISAVIVASATFTTPVQKMILSSCGVLIGALVSLLLCFSMEIENYLGSTGLNIITRIGGLILASLAAETIFQGIETFLRP